MAGYTNRELKADDRGEVERLIEAADRYQTLFIRPTLARFESFGGWWYGALADGTRLEAVMSVEDHVANVYAETREAIGAMAEEIFQLQVRLSNARPHRHQVIGEASSVEPLWASLKRLPRKLISDRTRTLMRAAEAPERSPSKRLALTFAEPSDLRLVYELTAEAQLERFGVDPRRTQREAHTQRCRAIIEQRRQLVGRAGDKPVLVAHLADIDDDTVMLDGIYVPRPFRTRKRLLGAGLHQAREVPLAEGRELLVFADDDLVQAAAELAGYRACARYRHVITLG